MSIHKTNRWIFFACAFVVVLNASCERRQRAIDQYSQRYELLNGKPFRAMLEYVQEKKTGNSFAIATIERSSVEIDSRLKVSFANQLFLVDGLEHPAADLKGKLYVWQSGEKSVVTMPDRFSCDTAIAQVRKLLDELNQSEMTP